jgi:hypothetical protein
VNVQTETWWASGSAGRIEALRDLPAPGVVPRGVAVIAHPHPLFGGAMHNKVVQTLARAFVQVGWTAVRFNFRGVGASEGVHDDGRGELEDLMAVVAQAAGTGWVFIRCICDQPCGAGPDRTATPCGQTGAGGDGGCALSGGARAPRIA